MIPLLFQKRNSNEKIPTPKMGITSERKAQSAVLGLLSILVLVSIAAGLVDIYRLYAARNWAYQVAQEAALAGVSRGRDWNSISGDGEIRLDSDIAFAEAQNILQAEMIARHIVGYNVDIRVLPEPDGGTISGYPPQPVRLGNSLGDWNSDEPSVGVSLTVPVDWLLLDRLGIVSKSVSVFAAAGVAQ